MYRAIGPNIRKNINIYVCYFKAQPSGKPLICPYSDFSNLGRGECMGGAMLPLIGAERAREKARAHRF